jgi:hypothetical protein
LKYYQKQEWEQQYIREAIGIVTTMYNENYKLTISATNDQADDSSDYFANIFSNNNEFENDELEDYLRKPITPFKTDLLQW